MSVSFSIVGDHTLRSDTNFSNGNAREVLVAIDAPFDDGLYGVWDGKVLEHVIKGATKALNNERTNYGRPQSIDGRVIECGTTDSRVRARIGSILEVCVNAKKRGESVCYG